MGVGIRELLIIVVLVLPTLLAWLKRHPHRTGIFLANVAGLLTFGLGWMVALAWWFHRADQSSSVLGQILSAGGAALSRFSGNDAARCWSSLRH